MRLLLIAAAALVAFVPIGTEVGATATAASAPCARPSIGFLGPLTGDAAFIGKEQLGFARYAIRRLGGGTVKLVEGDTQLDPAQAAKVAARLRATPNVLAVVGPANSREVLAVAPVFKRDRLPFVSGSALHSGLTNGSIPNFFRVVPNDGVQAPTLAAFLRRVLKPSRVLVVDDRSTYSRRLADGVQSRLRAGGIRVVRASVDQKATEFSALAERVDEDVEVVFLPWQIAASAQIFGQQLREQGKRPALVGSDTLDSGDFTIAGSYVSAFAPDIRGIKGNAAFIEGYGGTFVSNFGPLAYVATQAAIAAIQKACADGRATRVEVLRHLKSTHLRKTVLGGDVRFTATGDVEGARFSIFRVGAGGKKTMIR